MINPTGGSTANSPLILFEIVKPIIIIIIITLDVFELIVFEIVIVIAFDPFALATNSARRRR